MNTAYLLLLMRLGDAQTATSAIFAQATYHHPGWVQATYSHPGLVIATFHHPGFAQATYYA